MRSLTEGSARLTGQKCMPGKMGASDVFEYWSESASVAFRRQYSEQDIF